MFYMHKNCLSHAFAYLSGVLLDDSLNCTGTWGNMNFDFAIKLYGVIFVGHCSVRKES